MFRLDKKVVVLIGGNGRLGKSITEGLLKQGATLFSCDIVEFQDSYIKRINKEYPGKAFFKSFDASKKDQLIKLREEILKNHGTIDVLINSTTAKGDDFYLPFEEVSIEGWNIGLKGNLTLTFLSCQVFVKVMREQNFGSIINISSIYGLVGNDQDLYKESNLDEVYLQNTETKDNQIYSHAVYNASKGGVNSLTRYLAAYYGKYNVRVNTVTPGGIYHPAESEAFLKKYNSKVPLGRKAKLDEVNGGIIYLASDEASYVTGHNLVIDGGFTAW